MTVLDVDQAAPEAPFVRVVRGKPTVEELVALVTGLMVLQDTPAPVQQSAKARSAWTDRATLLNAHPFRRTSGDWQHSAAR
ncbi:MAG: acyl-CoA carboxylase subunit epsilon [Propionibacteriaceae bacterium]|nr:acyl-CoA carboxylase subunit epsilon [Propionibacteriaceae bacterium]